MKLREWSTKKFFFLFLALGIVVAIASVRVALERWQADKNEVKSDNTVSISGQSSPVNDGLTVPETPQNEEAVISRDTSDVSLREDAERPKTAASMARKTKLNSLKNSQVGLQLVKPVRELLAEAEARRDLRERDQDESARGDKPDEAARFRSLQMQDEKGEIPADGLQNARKQMDVMRDVARRKAAAAGKPEGQDVAALAPGDWAWLGPGNIGGRIRSIVIDPGDSNKMFVGSVSGGVWRTTNGGVSWSPVNDFMANLAVSTIVMHPTYSNIIYAGTGEIYSTTAPEGETYSAPKARGDGVFKSIDGGTTWTQLASTKTSDAAVCPAAGFNCPWSYVNRLAISPDGSAILAATNNGVWRSVDGGTTWNRTIPFIDGGQNGFGDIDFDPTNSQLAITSSIGGTAWFSTDGGQNWTQAQFIPAITGRVELAFAPSNPSVIYASVDQNQGEVYRSSNNGQIYALMNTGNNLLSTQGGYDNIIWVNPLDPTFVIVGGVTLWSSTDSGTNFTQISTPTSNANSAHPDHHMIVAHPDFDNNTNKTVYFTNDGGVYRADDVSTVSLTSGWTKLNNNLGITQFYSGAANSNGVIFGGTQDNGNIKVELAGNIIPPWDPQTWSGIPGAGGDGGYVAADFSDANFLYAEYVNLGLKRSSNGGGSASYIYCNPLPTNVNGSPCTGTGILDAFNGANFIAPFILDPREPNRMLAGGLSLWRSNDIKNTDPAQNNGLPSWVAIKPPVAPRPIPPGPAPTPFPSPTPPISAIAVSLINSDFIVVGYNDGQIYLTLDGTGTNPPPAQQCPPGFSPCWSRIDNVNNIQLTPTRFVTRLVIDETRSPNWIYATFGGFSGNNVFVTKDLGVTWIDVSGIADSGTDLPAVPVRSLAINSVHPDFIYAGTEVGIFASEDAGATWALPQDGPANVSVDELFWHNGDLFAATYGRGIYKTVQPAYIIGGGGGGPGSACPIAPPGCPCYGKWECPCTWNINRVPENTDDIGIACVTITGQFAQARNVRVNNRLTLNDGLSLSAQDVTNFGTITSNGTPGNVIQVRDLYNQSGLVSLHSISAQGDVFNGGIIALASTFGAGRDLNMGASATLTAGQTAGVSGNVSNSGAIVAEGIVVGGLSGSHTLSGSGTWRATNFNIQQGTTETLLSDITLDATNVYNNGVLNVGTHTLTNRGGQFASYFQSQNPMPGTGTLKFAPTSGNALYNGHGPTVRIASGTVEYQSGGTFGALTIDNGATFAMNTPGRVTVNGDVTVNGTISNAGFTPNITFNGTNFVNNGTIGPIYFLSFNDTGTARSQTVAGAGLFGPKYVQIGDPTSPTIVTLQTDATFRNDQFVVAAGSEFNVGNKTWTQTGAMPNTFAGRIAGTGLVKMQPISGTPTLGTTFSGGSLSIDPALEIVSGTVRSASAITNGPVTVDNGATLSLLGFFGMRANGNFINNGTLNAFSDTPTLQFAGNTLTNNGLVTGNVYVSMFSGPGTPVLQNLAGTGSWAGSPQIFIDAKSTTTLLNDFTYNGGKFWLEGRLNTGAFTFALPCMTTWSGAGDVAGNILRTGLSACPGAAIAYGSPFSTIQFTSGTPPTEIAFNVALSSPAGFPSAASRTYLITPFGGSGYTAALRLHYLDSELNGNNESTLQLWRNDGLNWLAQGATNRNLSDNWVEYSGVTQFSPWTLAGPPAPPTAPNAPSGLSATGVSISQIDLAWTDNSDNETGFKIERCGKGKGCSNAVEIAQVSANTTTYSNTGLAKATSYSYRVRAFNAVGNSAYSNIATGKTPRR